MKKKRCKKCKIEYPAELVQEMATSKGNTEVCGICALEISNQIHGDKRKRFAGAMAESIRKRAVIWRHNLGVSR